MTNQSTRTPAAPATRERPVFAPRTDIYESEASVVLVADMPGVDDQSVEVTLRFPKTAKPPVKLVVTGTKITPVEVPFKLTNVSIP